MKQKLLKLFKENGDNNLFVELQKEYGGLIVYYAQKINARTKYYGEDLEDCIQQCWIVFLKAVKNYDISSGHTFTAFLVSCLTHLMINSIRDLVRKRENIQVVSIDNYVLENETFSYLELFESDMISPSHQFEINEAMEFYKNLTSLTALEKEIFFQHLKGFTYIELAKKYSIPKKKIDNIIRKVKSAIEQKIK